MAVALLDNLPLSQGYPQIPAHFQRPFLTVNRPNRDDIPTSSFNLTESNTRHAVVRISNFLKSFS